MKKTIQLFLAISILGIGCKSTAPIQPKSVTSIKDLTIEHPTDFIELDKFDNLYIVNGDKLLLLNDKQEITYRYENDRYGSITSVDVSNPLKILVFYDEYDIVILLDNALAQIGLIQLSQLGYQDIKEVALSNDNKIWIYDPVTFTLQKIDPSGTVLTTSNPLYAQYIEPYQTTRLQESNNMVYMSDKQLGVLVFDNFGQYIKTIPLKELDDFQIKNNQLIYTNQEGVFFYGTNYFDTVKMEGLTEENANSRKCIRINKENVFIAFDQGVRVVER